MSNASYSDVVKGVRIARLQTQPMPDSGAAGAAVPALDWMPSPSSPPSRSSSASSSIPSAPLLPLSSYFPSLNGDLGVGAALPPQTPLMGRSWAAATRSVNSPPKLSSTAPVEKNGGDDDDDDDIVSSEPGEAEVEATQEASLHDGDTEDIHVSPSTPKASAMSDPLSPKSRRAREAQWFFPYDADLIIACRDADGGVVRWNVHSKVLMDMSDWMIKYIPPESEDGSPVEWELSHWDAGQMGAVLRYMYLERFEGGVYDPKRLLNTECVVINMVHFLAGTACLCRSMMDRALDQIDAMTIQIKALLPRLRAQHNLDQFESQIRLALAIMYCEPDQWRIRAIRMAMGKLLAVCFPLILQSARWNTHYKSAWSTTGFLQERVVADHRWLCQIGLCQWNVLIMAGFEHMVVQWVRYRKEGWEWRDDKMFPDDSDDQSDSPPPVSPPPTPAGGKKKSKAIPIIDPNSLVVPKQGQSASESNEKDKNCPTSSDMSAHGKGTTLDKKMPTVEVGVSSIGKSTATATSNVSSSIIQSTSSAKDLSARGTPATASNATSKSKALHGSAASKSDVSTQPLPHGLPQRPVTTIHPAIPAQKFRPGSPERMKRNQRLPSQVPERGVMVPVLPDGPFFFAESSTGVPDLMFMHQGSGIALTSFSAVPSAMESAAPSVVGGSTIIGSAVPSVAGLSSATVSATPSVQGGSSSASVAGSSIDPLDSPGRRLAELSLGGLDGSNDGALDHMTTPRASSRDQSKIHENLGQQMTSGDSPSAKDGHEAPSALASDESQHSAVDAQTATSTTASSTSKTKKKKKKSKSKKSR